jgi:hypothetical protein
MAYTDKVIRADEHNTESVYILNTLMYPKRQLFQCSP